MKAPGFRVIIIGGGIGGLALANSLQHAGVDYVLIEKGEELDPQVGASIGILPNGARLLDQLGCVDALTAMTVGMESTGTHKADGSLIGNISDVLKLIERRTGYAVIFIDRQLVLRTLAQNIKESHRIRLRTSVDAIDQSEDKVTVHCKDGTVVEGDLVVGADGVHSIVRHEMWRHADFAGDGAEFEQDKKAMSAEYKCLFGISNSLPSMNPGETDRTYAEGISTLSYIGKEGKIFWFVFIKMDKTYYPPNIPKFTSEDTEATIAQIGDLALRERGKVTIADVYRAKTICNLVAVEEAAYKHWSYGRLVCLGDAIHKMTPNLGAGASSAMESAAVLSNVLIPAVSASSRKLSLSDIRKCLREYQAKRELRIGRTMATTNKLTRLQALQTKKDYIITHYIAPHADDLFTEMFSDFVIGAPIMEHLPIPEKSLQGTMPFNPKMGWGYEETTSERARGAWPLAILALLSFISSLHLSHQIHHTIPALQDFHFPRALSSDNDLGLSISRAVIYGLWLLESTRLTHKSNLAQIPIFFGLLWLYGDQDGIVPLYFFLLYIFSPIKKFRAADNRLTDLSYTYTVGPLILFLAAIPAFLKSPYTSINLDNYQNWVERLPSSQALLPISITALQFLFVRIIRKSTIKTDRLWKVQRDVVPIRYTTALLAIISSSAWITQLSSLVITSSQSQSQTHIATSSLHAVWSMLSGKGGTLLTLSAVFWLTAAFADLHKAGMLENPYTKLFILGSPVLLCLGPGTLLVLGWQWREEILIHRAHRDAVVRRSFEYEPGSTPSKPG